MFNPRVMRKLRLEHAGTLSGVDIAYIQTWSWPSGRDRHGTNGMLFIDTPSYRLST
jgi:hypothetical protein